jgi:hypothetical protein
MALLDQKPAAKRPRPSDDSVMATRATRAPPIIAPTILERSRTNPAFSPDSPLEGTGFEPSVPLFAKGVSRLLPAGPIIWTQVIKHRSSRETTMVGRGPLLHAVFFTAGPMVRIHLPPAGSLVRTQPVGLLPISDTTRAPLKCLLFVLRREPTELLPERNPRTLPGRASRHYALHELRRTVKSDRGH